MADSIVSVLVEQIEKVVDEKVKKSVESSTIERNVATVVETDLDGTIWVHLEGGLPTTPITGSSATVVPGQTVNVVNVGGKLYIDGNYTSQAVGTAEYVEVKKDVEVVDDKANRAMSAADIAEQSAIDALQSADVAATAASEAQESAEQAVQDAATASEQAQSAQNSATQANSYAIGALSGLSDVEKVVGTLNWISEHGVYSPTTDNVVQADKSYYTYDGTDYVPVQEPTQDGLYSYALTSDTAIDPEKTYYTRNVEYAYFLTHDTEIVEGKTYYALDEETGEYEEVEEPDVADIATYYERSETVGYVPVEEPDVADIGTYYERSVAYYELGIDVSVQNYISSHLSLTNEGLNLTADSSMYRAVLGVDGLRILDPQGKVVGVHGQAIQLGATDGVYFEATSNRLAFRTSDQDIAWFGQNSDGIWEMHIQNTYAEDMVRFGNYAFIKRDNGNMSLKWLGDDS